MPVRIAIAGAGGRMGRMLIEAVLADAQAQLVAALDQPGSPAIGQDAGAALGRHTGVAVSGDAAAALAGGVDVLIDFTRPEGTMAHLALARRHGVKLVVGTTGFTPEQKAAIGAAAQDIGIVFAPNMSVGVNVLVKLVEAAAAALDERYDAEVYEVHHRHKVDAPSGTALALGEAVARGRGVNFAERAVLSREGHTGERRRGDIGFGTLRGGDIIGEHLVMFAGTGERIEIAHKSGSRANYAEGSLRAAHFLAAHGPGLYGMADVLGL
ncbi:MAG: 4-hydroxy-tetrahydrodipicolinate reductase [Rubrivivax sp.]|nr:4-hydroxy-tetrahydrodipicolinate reductase [Rubrivivax sp.]